MIYLFNLNNFIFNKPINKISLKIFKFNIILLIFFFSFLNFYFILLFFFVFFFRKNIKNNNNLNFKLKKIFFFINSVFILFLIYFSSILLFKLKKKYKPYVTIKIIGYQWRWYYNYIKGVGKNINYFSTIIINFNEIINLTNNEKFYLQRVDNKLVLPVNKNIRLIFTSNDVIHSWFIPSLSFKQDAIPGFNRDCYFKSNTIGKYKGYCTELCGRYHSYMPILINIINIISYKKWVLSSLYYRFLFFNF